MHPLARAIKASGLTQEKFAEAIGKRQSYVSMLLHRTTKKGRPVPAEICPAIEQATAGKVTRYDLRPDVFGAAPTKPAPAPAERSRRAA